MGTPRAVVALGRKAVLPPATCHHTGGPEGVTLGETSLSRQDTQDVAPYTGAKGAKCTDSGRRVVPGAGRGWGFALQGDEFGGWPWRWLQNRGDVLNATEPCA